MTLSPRVDLTEHRDFRKELDFDLDLDLISFKYDADLFAPVVEGEFVHIRRIYPWNVFDLDSLDFPQSFQSEDELSMLVGFDFYGTVEHPFLTGDHNTRTMSRSVLQEEFGLHCECCGKELDIFDQELYIRMCRNCAKEFGDSINNSFPWN